jgi:hypothetical protein
MRQKLLEYRHSKLCDKIDGEHTKQRNAAQYVDGVDAVGRPNWSRASGRTGCGDRTSQFMIVQDYKAPIAAVSVRSRHDDPQRLAFTLQLGHTEACLECTVHVLGRSKHPTGGAEDAIR